MPTPIDTVAGPLETQVSELTSLLTSVGEANARAAELMAELEEAREILEARNQELERQRIELEQALQTARCASAAKEAQSRFLANISHEMRTPLNGVLGMSSILLSTTLSQDQVEFTHNIQKSAGSLLCLVNDLLDLAKIEAGHLTLEHQPLSPLDCIESAMQLVAPAAHSKGLELILDPVFRFPKTLVGDAGRFQQILRNLLSNAVKFTPSGEIVVSAEVAESDAKSVLLRVAVRDTGIGIPLEVQGQLFSPFTQAEASTARVFGGTGLGLAISRNLAEQMGGSIQLQSVPTRGSTFTFTVRMECQHPFETLAFNRLPSRPLLIVAANAKLRSSVAACAAAWGLIPASRRSVIEALYTLADDSDPPIVVADADLADSSFLVETVDPKRLLLLSAPRANNQLSSAVRSYSEGHRLYKPVSMPVLWEKLAELCGVRSHSESEGLSEKSPSPESYLLNALVVDDNEINLLVASHTLRRLGLQVEVAADGYQALDLLGNGNFDIVFMDCQMPGLDGYETARMIRQSESTTRLPIVALTAHAMLGDREKCFAAGMDEYLSKPLATPALQALLTKLFPMRA